MKKAKSKKSVAVKGKSNRGRKPLPVKSIQVSSKMPADTVDFINSERLKMNPVMNRSRFVAHIMTEYADARRSSSK